LFRAAIVIEFGGLFTALQFYIIFPKQPLIFEVFNQLFAFHANNKFECGWISAFFAKNGSDTNH
jgi:hypothetical protein